MQSQKHNPDHDKQAWGRPSGSVSPGPTNPAPYQEEHQLRQVPGALDNNRTGLPLASTAVRHNGHQEKDKEEEI